MTEQQFADHTAAHTEAMDLIAEETPFILAREHWKDTDTHPNQFEWPAFSDRQNGVTVVRANPSLV